MQAQFSLGSLLYTLHLFLVATTSTALGGEMDVRLVAEDIAITVNEALSTYISIHDDIFKVKARRLIPVLGVYEAIDYQSHVETLSRVDSTLIKALVEIDSARSRGNRDGNVDSFLISLKAYSEALLDTIQQFKSISSKLYEKSQKSSAYKWATYSEDLDNYHSSISHYIELGGELNRLYSRMMR